MNAEAVTKRIDGGEDAEAFVDRWRRVARATDAVRLAELRQMSELESARRFARLLSLPLPYPLRKTSGLVQQQRMLSRLRQTQ